MRLAHNLYSAGRMARMKSEATTYKLEMCLGEGLSSCVYKAERLDSRGHSKQQVVLKILKNQNQVEWLRQEFEALSKIDSAFCVRMLAWENLKLGPALVLEYIEGITLYELLLSGNVENEIISEIIAQIQLGLQCLEQARRFHGDLNLKNIMIDKTGCVKLIDFATSLLDFSVSKEIIGTPPYLAPEIWSGGARSIKSDLFALGLIEYDLKNGLSQIPLEQVACRLRAEALKDAESSFLNADPTLRSFKKQNRNLYAKKQLGKCVIDALRLRSSQPQQTLRLSLNHPVKRRFQMAILSILAISCFVIPVTSRPLHDTTFVRVVRTGTLEVRTRQWIEIIIDGKNYGYAPLVISKFKPGIHLLKWISHSSSGEMKFRFESGELRILKDKDFSHLLMRALVVRQISSHLRARFLRSSIEHT